jgi:anaerobic ribonucleoside-triphosphate reductase
MLRCTYMKCSYEWEYFGRRKWAKCPACHSVVRVALAKKNLGYHQRALNAKEFKNE